MEFLLLFSVTLLVAIYVSEYADRSILSATVLFLFVGIAAGIFPHTWIGETDRSMVNRFAEVALFVILFTDGMNTRKSELMAGWQLPARALLIGLPLTLLGTAAAAHWIVGFSWLEALLLGAVLSPTDPVLVSAIVGHERVPRRLRMLLNIESGINDGLVLPVVILLLSVIGQGQASLAGLAADVGLGILAGLVIPWLAVKLERMPVLKASDMYRQLLPAAVAILLFALCRLSHANEFLAAFTAGVVIGNLDRSIQEQFHAFGEKIAELLKLAAVLLFGGLVSHEIVQAIAAPQIVFVGVALLLVRPLTILLSLRGAGMARSEVLVAGWFGPKGFASVTYSLLIAGSDIANAELLFHVSALVIATSIIAHASTDVLVVRWLTRARDAG